MNVRQCDDAVVVEVATHPGSTAAEVADATGVDRKAAVHLLHAHFDECLVQDNSYRWWPLGTEPSHEPEPAIRATEPDVSISDHRPILRYFLDAVVADSRDEVSVWAQSSKPQYVSVDQHPVAEETYAITSPDVLRFADDAMRQSQRFMLGAAVFADFQNATSGFKLLPLFTWSIASTAGELKIEPLSITVNAAVLAALEGKKTATAEQVVSLQVSLGIDRPDQLPPFDEVMSRLGSLYPGWPWAEHLDPTNLGTQPALNMLSASHQQGLYNRVMLVATERAIFTRGLETELTKLSQVQVSSLEGTALGLALSSATAPHTTGDTANEPMLVEAFPLNAEQRRAVKSSLSEPLTVVTGPPGTGKSQVVASIIMNAAIHGQTVLFASRNQKAVDVVESRVNALTSRKSVLRLGGQHVGDMVEYLTGLLAQSSDAASVAQLDETRLQLEKSNRELASLEGEIAAVVMLRNETDRLDAEAAEARRVLPGELVDDPQSVNVADALTLIEPMKSACVRADRDAQTVITRLLWFTVAPRRRRAAEAGLNALSDVIPRLGLGMPTAPLTSAHATELTSALRGRLSLVESLQTFDDAARRLSDSVELIELHRQQVEATERHTERSEAVWRAWLRTQRHRMTGQQQKDIGKLIAVARALAGNWTPQLAEQFASLLEKVRELLPMWAITSLSLRGRILLSGGLFDLVVIDEASQCDMASAFPLLYRAKRAVIIGDPMQLRHITSLAAAADENLRSRHGLGGRVEWSYRTESLFDLGARLSDSTVFLRDHHRSHRDIIEFSNREFYDGQLRVATRYDRLVRPDPPTAIRWIPVGGAFTNPGGSGGLNAREAGAVVAELERLQTQGYRGTVGVVTPFRAQATRIRQMSDSRLSSEFLDRSELEIGVAHTFQGDEKDVILFSPVLTAGASRGAQWFVGDPQNRNLFNVAVTRARSALVVIGDKEAPELIDIPIFSRFLAYIESLDATRNPQPESNHDLGGSYPARHRGPSVSKWEHRLYEALHAAGIFTTPQVEEDAYRLDLALYAGDRRLDIEVDGERYHATWDGDYVYSDRLRNQRLIELGWDVKRFWVWEVRDNLQQCVERVEAWFEAATR